MPESCGLHTLGPTQWGSTLLTEDVHFDTIPDLLCTCYRFSRFSQGPRGNAGGTCLCSATHPAHTFIHSTTLVWLSNLDLQYIIGFEGLCGFNGSKPKAVGGVFHFTRCFSETQVASHFNVTHLIIFSATKAAAW